MLISGWMQHETLREYVATDRYTSNFQTERLRLVGSLSFQHDNLICILLVRQLR
jgi:hypothetical protein